MRGQAILSLFVAALGVTACTYYDDHEWLDGSYGNYRYAGRTFSDPHTAHDKPPFAGSGADILDPWLAQTREGRQVVGFGFDRAQVGRISEETAQRANVWFRRYADQDHDLRLTDEEIRTALVHAALASSRRY